MFTKLGRLFIGVGLLVLVVALAAPTFVHAGGWAVITLDELPDEVIAGQPLTIGFMVRQHGRTPIEIAEIPIEVRHSETGETLTFTATPDGETGHYRAELSFPQPGRWVWEIQSGLFPDRQPMPALDVAAEAVAAVPNGNGATQGLIRIPGMPSALLAVVAVLALAAGAVIIARSRGKRFPTLAGVGLMVLAGVLTFAFFSSTAANAELAQPASQPAGDADAGARLFLAKGCVVCHVNDWAIKGSQEYGVDAGPNLTEYRNDPDFLRQFLADPTAVKPNSDMPNLGLADHEIEALVRFINEEAE